MFGRLINLGESNDHGADSGNVSSGSIEGAEEQERNNDLREHMVGILFSRSKLTHLQKQVSFFLLLHLAFIFRIVAVIQVHIRRECLSVNCIS